MRDLIVTPAFEKDWQNLPKNTRLLIEPVVFDLRKNPVDPMLSIKKLVGTKHKLWRIRIGTYRLIYTYNKTELLLIRIGQRKNIYRDMF